MRDDLQKKESVRQHTLQSSEASTITLSVGEHDTIHSEEGVGLCAFPSVQASHVDLVVDADR